MKITNRTKLVSLILIFALVTAIAVFISGCADKKADATPNNAVTDTAGAAVSNGGDSKDTSNALKPSTEDVTKLGEGKKTISFTVKDADRKETTFEIKSDKATVGEALLDEGLISGSKSEYGLMVDTVMGIRADYNLDKAYWSFYIGGEYAQTGVDSTELVDGEFYMFEYTKA